MFFKCLLKFFLVLQVTLGVANASCSSGDYPERRKDLQPYQDASQCYPLTDTWYMLLRNYEEDPALGGTAKCVRGTETGPVEDDMLSVHVQYSPDVSVNGTMTLKSFEGYDVKNLLNFGVDGETETIEQIVAFGLCDKCVITRQLYIADGSGAACAIWVPESTLEDISMCCTFVFDLLCGTAEKHYIYDESCRGEV